MNIDKKIGDKQKQEQKHFKIKIFHKIIQFIRKK